MYEGFRKQFMTGLMKLERGNPVATAEAILNVVDAERPPLRLTLVAHGFLKFVQSMVID